MTNIIDFNTVDTGATRSLYLRGVEDFVKIQATIDLMRAGITQYSKDYPKDDQMAYGAMQALYYQMHQAECLLAKLNKYRDILGMGQLENTLREASETIFKDHYGIDITNAQDDDDDTI